MSHTSRQWAALDLGHKITIVDTETQQAICRIENEVAKARPLTHEDRDNANLIIAAPRLLAASGLAEEILQTALERLGDEETRGLVRSAIIELREAIGMAEKGPDYRDSRFWVSNSAMENDLP